MKSCCCQGKATFKRRLANLAVAVLFALSAIALADPSAGKGSREGKRNELVPSRPISTPLMAIVALKEQRVTIYDADGQIMRAPVSSGQTDYETPAGIYSVIQKEAEHYSNLYDDASMPFMQRITWSGIALHAGPLPGYAASHGCVRMPYEFAKHLFDITKIGMRVIVARDDVHPVEITHPVLFRPRPIQNEIALASQSTGRPTSSEEANLMRVGIVAPEATESEVPSPAGSAKHVLTLKSIVAAKSAEADAAVRKADAARLIADRKAAEAARFVRAQRTAEGAKLRGEGQLKAAEQMLETATAPEAIQRAEDAKAKALNKLAEAKAQLEFVTAQLQPSAEAAARAREEAQAAEAAKVAALDAAKEARRKMAPLSAFISRQTQRLYVRQAFQPLFESPVTIRDADKPIGTHIYTALDYMNGGADVRWSVVSMYESPTRRDAGSNGKSRRGDNNPIASDASVARAALDRIEIPQEALDRISEVVPPGSSLIISDEGLSKETGKDTEFVILMSGEPQGGIKMRHRNPEDRFRYDSPFDRGYGRSYWRSPFDGGSFFRW
jgi:L,D-transpeptidase catalytic domain